MILTPQMMKDKKLYRYETISDPSGKKVIGFRSIRIDNLFNFEAKHQTSKPYVQATTRRKPRFF
jgi:hypothetical protein